MSDLLSTVSTLSQDIGGFKDGIQLRQQIQSNVKQLMETSKSVKQNIQILRENDDPEIDAVQSTFDTLSNRMREQLPRVINSLKAETPGGDPSRDQAISSQSLLMDQQMINSDSDQLAMLENEVNTILTIMREVNALFEKTMAELQSQRHIIIGVDKMTTKAAEDMTMGTLELEKATEHQKKSRKCLCWILLLVLVVVAVVIIIIAVVVTKNKKDDPQPEPTPTPRPSVNPTPPPVDSSPVAQIAHALLQN